MVRQLLRLHGYGFGEKILWVAKLQRSTNIMVTV